MECVLVHVQAFSKFNYNYKHILTDRQFSKFLHFVPLPSAFQSILKNPKYSTPLQKRPIWARTDKGKEFLNRHFQEMLKHNCIQFQVWRNPFVKSSIIERAERTIRDRLYKYFTYQNTQIYRCTPKICRSLQCYSSHHYWHGAIKIY